jgi:lipopolysaccharide/colanic/teichoic acid biosynthesis glycosyltransferase
VERSASPSLLGRPPLRLAGIAGRAWWRDSLRRVLRGEMSLVGPRPEQVELVARYRTDERFRLTVKPGMTGPMQVFGRGELTFEERLAVERDYIENLSFGRDLRLLALTFVPLVTGRGAS